MSVSKKLTFLTLGASAITTAAFAQVCGDPSTSPPCPPVVTPETPSIDIDNNLGQQQQQQQKQGVDIDTDYLGLPNPVNLAGYSAPALGEINSCYKYASKNGGVSLWIIGWNNGKTVAEPLPAEEHQRCIDGKVQIINAEGAVALSIQNAINTGIKYDVAGRIVQDYIRSADNSCNARQSKVDMGLDASNSLWGTTRTTTISCSDPYNMSSTYTSYTVEPQPVATLSAPVAGGDCTEDGTPGKWVDISRTAGAPAWTCTPNGS